MKKLKAPILLALLFLPLAALAQSNGVGPQSGASSAVAAPAPAATRATSTATAPATPRATPVIPAAPPVAPIAAPTSSPIPQTIPPAEDTGGNTLLWIALAALVVLPFGFLATQALKSKKTKEDKQDNPGCFDIKKLLNDKLEEITDLKGRIEGKVQDKAREKISEAFQGTSAGEALALLIKAEAQYGKLKKLYEECTAELERRSFKGIIIEQSLGDKSIFDKVNVKKTYTSGDWTLNDVLVGEKQIPELSKYLAEGPWYIHLWKAGTDEVKVIYKNEVFNIKHSDKSTWADAIAYGTSIGIPDEQLDFPID